MFDTGKQPGKDDKTLENIATLGLTARNYQATSRTAAPFLEPPRPSSATTAKALDTFKQTVRRSA
jgi:hypothetical protein